MQQQNHKKVFEGRILGIDPEKWELINFLIEQEGLNSFSENEHFYYWFHAQEWTIGTSYAFIKPGIFLYDRDGKSYDINSFDGIARLVIDVKNVNEVDAIFSGPPMFRKEEFFLRYSKKYKRLEYYTCMHTIEKTRNRDKYYIRHKQFKFFSVNEKNYVRIYVSNRMVRYISNKSVAYFKGGGRYRNTTENFNLKVNRRLLNLHLGNELYKNDENFLEENLSINHIPNKFLKGCKSFEEILSKMTKNRPVPKILRSKLETGDVISLYHLVEYDEMDKVIKFLYEYHDFYVKVNYFGVLENYLGHRVGIMRANKEKKKFEYTHDHKRNVEVNTHNVFFNSEQGEVRDYIRMSLALSKKLNINIRSLKRLKLEHDELSRKISSNQLPKIKVHKSYPEIESGEGFRVEKIDEKTRLVMESDIQKHCVKTYASRINRGDCCIYSLLDESDGRRYTLEVNIHKNKALKKQVFVLNQIRGKFNANPNNEVIRRVSSLLKKHGTYLTMEDAVNDGFVLEPRQNQTPFNGHWINGNVLEIDDDQLPF